MGKFLQITFASSLSLLSACADEHKCNLSGNGERAYSMAEVDQQCRQNRQLIQKCIIVPNEDKDMYGKTFNCSDTNYQQILGELIDRTYLECRSSMDANDVKLSCE